MTLRVRSIVWFVTGAVLATSVTLMFVNAWRVDAAPGDEDATFVPITACRLADTRPAPDRIGSAAALGPAGIQGFAAHGTNGNCTIPTDAVALALNVTAVGATAPTFLTLWPDGDRPTASSLNPAPSQPPTPNAVNVDLSDTGSFNVFNRAGSVNVIIDVTGYYTSASLAELANRLTALESSSAIASSNIAANAAAVGSLRTTADANTAAIGALDTAQPFTVTSRDSSEAVGTIDEVVVSVSVTAPVAGQVSVHSTASANELTAGDDVVCSITDGTALNLDFVQRWQSSGSSDGQHGQLAGTRVFDIAAGATAVYNLICRHLGASGSTGVDDSVLTAIFTPAP